MITHLRRVPNHTQINLGNLVLTVQHICWVYRHEKHTTYQVLKSKAAPYTLEGIKSWQCPHAGGEGQRW